MNWLIRIAMSVSEALSILEFPSGVSPSLEQIQQQWKRLIFKNHPDRGGDESLAKRMNFAWTFLQQSYSQNSGTERNPWKGEDRWTGPYHPSGGRPNRRDIPEWQTDERSSNNVGQDRGDINYALKDIYEFSQGNGPVEKYTFWAYDGRYLRGTFTAKSNPESFGYAGEVMEDWNGSAGNSYNTVAVLAQKSGAREVKLIRLQGEDFSGQDYWLPFYSINSNPGNDPEFTRNLNELIENI